MKEYNRSNLLLNKTVDCLLYCFLSVFSCFIKYKIVGKGWVKWSENISIRACFQITSALIFC